jgi:hypothetical protein
MIHRSTSGWLILLCACGPDAAKVCASPGINAELGTVDTTNGDLTQSDDGTKKFLNVSLNDDLAQDQLQMELYPNGGAFAGGPVRPGTYDLGGGETAYDTCGACVLLYQDLNPDNGKPAGYYMPLGGTLTLTSTEGRLAGTLHDVLFRHVTIDFTSSPIGKTTTIDDGCRAVLDQAAFDLEYPAALADAGI